MVLRKTQRTFGLHPAFLKTRNRLLLVNSECTLIYSSITGCLLGVRGTQRTLGKEMEVLEVEDKTQCLAMDKSLFIPTFFLPQYGFDLCIDF